MQYKRKSWRLLPLARAISVLSAVGIVTTMVTFAAIQSSGSALTGNTIQTATAALKVSTDDTTYADNVAGFTFSGLVPGGPAQSANTGASVVYVKNIGTATLNLSLMVPTPPTVTGVVDLSKVNVVLMPVGSSTPQSFTLSSLLAGTMPITNSSVTVGTRLSYHVQVSMAADAVTGSGATITNLNLSFSGTP